MTVRVCNRRMAGWVRGKCGRTKHCNAGAVWRQEEAPCRKVSTSRQDSDDGNKDILSTECDMKLEGTNKEAGNTGRTKDAKRQSRMDLDRQASDN
jgi:hypothetical protein